MSAAEDGIEIFTCDDTSELFDGGYAKIIMCLNKLE